jgi:hypothetical protein
METAFYIVINMRTCNGFEQIAKFSMGNDPEFASSVFDQLQGSTYVNEENFLQFDLKETADRLPVNIRMINCTLELCAINCKIITKELFKHFNLREI